MLSLVSLLQLYVRNGDCKATLLQALQTDDDILPTTESLVGKLLCVMHSMQSGPRVCDPKLSACRSTC